jgi:hypothetical protein
MHVIVKVVCCSKSQFDLTRINTSLEAVVERQVYISKSQQLVTI